MEEILPTPSSATAIPKPQGIFDPVARALEAVGDRWTLVLIRQLLGGPLGFQELRQRTGIAPRVLSGRLRELAAKGFVESQSAGNRSVYALTEEGRSLEPVVVAIGRWWIQRGLEALGVDGRRFTETSAQSVIDSLPFMVREERARDVDLTFEIRLDGNGGGVWSVRVHAGISTTRVGIADGAQVRYTADASTWCGVALGLLDAREAFRHGLLNKEGEHYAMDHFFHQIPSAQSNKETAQ
jgi:DNA-binding HxlR family transcriptional regulator